MNKLKNNIEDLFDKYNTKELKITEHKFHKSTLMGGWYIPKNICKDINIRLLFSSYWKLDSLKIVSLVSMCIYKNVMGKYTHSVYRDTIYEDQVIYASPPIPIPSYVHFGAFL